ncbi:MAG: hypothetical protein MZV63_29385 [Marinilabiliales bacterium]|nr:hypothetical protein [Marinilabiliales bacterium]
MEKGSAVKTGQVIAEAKGFVSARYSFTRYQAR